MVKWLTLGFSLFLILIVVLADMGAAEVLFELIVYVPGGDKTGHFVLMGLLSLLVNLSLHATRINVGPLRVLKGSVIVAVIVTLEEFSQRAFASRGFSLLDLLADYAGILLFGELAAWITVRRLAPERARSRTRRT